MTSILAIDPGSTLSAWVKYVDGRPTDWAKESNEAVLALVWNHPYDLAIESIASYGMAVGAEVFETCVWSGRFIQAWIANTMREPMRVYRRDVKLHLCGTSRAKDANVRQAIIDRYAPNGGGKLEAVGLKAAQGPLYGMKADCWQATGVAITAAETRLLGAVA